MKKFVMLAIAMATLSSITQAQNHGEAGVYADYFRLQTAPQDFLGTGARVSFNVHPNLALEADGAYDFRRSRNQFITSKGVSSTSRSNFRIGHGLFGPKLQFGKKSPIRVFATVKGGFIRFGVNNGPATFGNAFASSNSIFRAAAYAGGGAEAFWHWLGLRIDVGDEAYFDRGPNSNLKATFGPHIRF